MTFHTWIGGTLRDERKRLKLSMQQVADRAGVSQPAVVRLERGEGSKLDTLNRVADALGLTVAVVKLPGHEPAANE